MGSETLSVLLVDDSPDDRLLIQRNLRQTFTNARITEIQSIEAFEQELSKGQFDLVITEERMNWTDGLTVLRAVKTQYPHTPVSMLAMVDVPRSIVSALKDGLDDYLSKADIAQLNLSIERAWERANQRRAAREAEVERERLLLERQEQLRQLTRQIIRAQEEERKRVARELHDELGQELIVLQLDLRTIRDSLHQDDFRERIEESIQAIERITNSMRSLSMDLRPLMLDDIGLEAALRWYTTRYQQRTGIETSLSVNAMETRLPEEIELTIFRCVQEALTNAARYARATQIEVRLEWGQVEVIVTVADNGVGFNSVSENGGTGLLGLRERLELVNGSMIIEAAPEKGSIIKIRIHL